VNPALRTAWAMLNIKSIAMFAIAIPMLASVPVSPQVVQPLATSAIGAAFGMLATHIAGVLAVGVWRVLPDGSRTVSRAIAGIVAVLSLVFGTLFHLAAPGVLEDMPFGTVLAVFIHVSSFGFLLLLGIGRQLPRFFTLLYLIACSASFGITTATLGDIPAFWIGGAALCAAAWIYASVAGFRSPNYSRRRFAWDVGLETLAARADRPSSPGRSPALALLRSGRAGSFNVLIAVIVIVLVAVSQHMTIGRLGMVPLLMFLAMPLTGISIFASFHAARFAPGAKCLWLRHTDSRAELFGLVERTAIRDVSLVAATGWAVLAGLAVVRGVAIGPIDALKLLVAFVGAPVTLVYVGLLLSSAYGTWAKVLTIVLAIGCTVQAPGWWLGTVGGSHLVAAGGETATGKAVRFALALLAIVTLRYVAASRWKRLDWSHYRALRQ
jgi:hypothetical protein